MRELIEPMSKPEMLEMNPIRSLPVRGAGRPAKPVTPMPADFNFDEDEQNRFDWFIYSFNKENPDLTPSDKLILELAGVEYIKLLRMCAKEIEEGQLITMARQNPGTNFRSYLEMLSVTRKARQSRPAASPNDEKADQLLKLLSGSGKRSS